MKKIVSLLLSALLFLSPALCAADTTLPGGFLCLEEGSGYAMSVKSDDGTCEITDPDGNLFTCKILPLKEISTTEEYIRSQMPTWINRTFDNGTYGDRVSEVNGFMYIPMRSKDGRYGYAAVGFNVLLSTRIEGSEDITAYERLLGALRPADGETAEAQAPAAAYRAFSTEDVVGFYDVVLMNTRYTNDTLILTTDGHGRISTSVSSIIFDYVIRDGQIQPNTDSVTFTLLDDGSITIRTDSIEYRFVKRDPIAGSPRMTGKWKLSKCVGAKDFIIEFRRSVLHRISVDPATPLVMEFTAYDDGTVDWYSSVSDSEKRAAMGWGIDEDGLYFFNGKKNPCTLEDGVLCVSLNGDSSQQLFFTYSGPVE